MRAEALVPVLRPDRTLLWLPGEAAQALGVCEGDALTVRQYDSPRIQQLLAERNGRENKGRQLLEENQ